MKKLFILIAILSVGIAVNAQLRTRVMPSFNAGSQSAFGVTGYTIPGTGAADTLAVSDTVMYVYPINASNYYVPFISIKWTKIGSGTATITAAFLQGNTSGNLTPVLQQDTTSTIAYTKTLTYSATGVSYINFLADKAWVSGNYLAIKFTTSSTASVSGSIAGTLKTQIQ